MSGFGPSENNQFNGKTGFSPSGNIWFDDITGFGPSSNATVCSNIFSSSARFSQIVPQKGYAFERELAHVWCIKDTTGNDC